MAPTENVAADANDGSEANTGTVSAREGISTSLEVSIVSGVSGVSVSASVDAGMDQNNNSNDITTNNKYPKAQRRKHNNIAPINAKLNTSAIGRNIFPSTPTNERIGIKTIMIIICPKMADRIIFDVPRKVT